MLYTYWEIRVCCSELRGKCKHKNKHAHTLSQLRLAAIHAFNWLLGCVIFQVVHAQDKVWIAEADMYSKLPVCLSAHTAMTIYVCMCTCVILIVCVCVSLFPW